MDDVFKDLSEREREREREGKGAVFPETMIALAHSRRGLQRLRAVNFTSATTSTSIDVNDGNRENVRRRLLYRSQQRGWLELDLVMGQWAQENLSSLNDELLKEYSELLDEENPDLFKWFTGQLKAPDRVQKNFAFGEIQKEIKAKLQVGNSMSMNTTGAEWVRGWNDRDKPK